MGFGYKSFHFGRAHHTQGTGNPPKVRSAKNIYWGKGLVGRLFFSIDNI